MSGVPGEELAGLVLARVCEDLAARRQRAGEEGAPLPGGGPGVLDAHLAPLLVFFEKQADKALDLVESGAVKKVVGEGSGRAAFQVEGHGETYVVFPDHFCSCMSFYFDVVTKKEAHMCKHLLATRLAEATARCTTVVVPDTHLAEILMEL